MTTRRKTRDHKHNIVFVHPVNPDAPIKQFTTLLEGREYTDRVEQGEHYDKAWSRVMARVATSHRVDHTAAWRWAWVFVGAAPTEAECMEYHKEFITAGLWDLAQHASDDVARVAAAAQLCRIFGMEAPTKEHRTITVNSDRELH